MDFCKGLRGRKRKRSLRNGLVPSEVRNLGGGEGTAGVDAVVQLC